LFLSIGSVLSGFILSYLPSPSSWSKLFDGILSSGVLFDGAIKGLIGLLSSARDPNVGAGLGGPGGPHHHHHHHHAMRHHLPPGLGDLVSLGLVNPTS